MDFEKELQKQLDQLPYEKHVDDGQYNDGKLVGFEAGARWAFSLLDVSESTLSISDIRNKLGPIVHLIGVGGGVL